MGAIPYAGRALIFLFRCKYGLTYARRPVKLFLKWLFTSNEYTNFTYSIGETNKYYLAAFVAHITDIEFGDAMHYLRELEHNNELRTHIEHAMSQNSKGLYSAPDIYYGRRLGWYAIVRAAKPKVVVETGVDKGLGSCVLAEAIRRNQQEGHPGYYYGTDINPDSGFLFGDAYKEYGQILYGDSITSLSAFDKTIDLFINDSDHSADYEAREYRLIEDKLSENAIVLGDNAHVTDALVMFAWSTGRRFLYFDEWPEDHWYPGAGIGAAF